MPKPNTTKPRTRHSVTRPSATRRAVAQALDHAKRCRRASDLIGVDLRVFDGVPVTAVLPAEGLVKLRTVLAVFPVSEASWWAGIRANRYPKPVHIGVKSRAWRVSDIRALIKATEEAEPLGTYRLPGEPACAEA